MPSAIKTPNISLNQWQGNENPKRQDFVDDNSKIDEAIGKFKELVENISMKAKDITIEDADNLFTSTHVEGALKENKVEIESLKQSGVNIKSGMKNAINSKLTVPDVTDNDTWATYTQRVNDIKEGRGNAQISDVLVGKTFTNDGGQMLTGTFVPIGIIGGDTITLYSNTTTIDLLNINFQKIYSIPTIPYDGTYRILNTWNNVDTYANIQFRKSNGSVIFNANTTGIGYIIKDIALNKGDNVEIWIACEESKTFRMLEVKCTYSISSN